MRATAERSRWYLQQNTKRDKGKVGTAKAAETVSSSTPSLLCELHLEDVKVASHAGDHEEAADGKEDHRVDSVVGHKAHGDHAQHAHTHASHTLACHDGLVEEGRQLAAKAKQAGLQNGS